MQDGFKGGFAVGSSRQFGRRLICPARLTLISGVELVELVELVKFKLELLLVWLPLLLLAVFPACGKYEDPFRTTMK